MTDDEAKLRALLGLPAEASFWPNKRMGQIAQAMADRENREDRPRPSRAMQRMWSNLNAKDTQWALDHRGSLLVELRGMLRDQPRWQRSKGPPQLPPKAAEGFAGGGLFSLAASVEGVKLVDVCEIDKWAVKTLNKNLALKTASKDAFKWSPIVPHGGLDLLIGGPPCQPFSPGASLGRGVVGPANHKNAFPRVLDWLVDAQPRVAIMENSIRIATDRDYQKYFRRWGKQAKDAGYDHTIWRMYAPDYGTPQNRARAFVVLWPTGAPWGARLKSPPKPTHGRPGAKGVRPADRAVSTNPLHPLTKHYDKLPWVSVFDRLNSGCCGHYGKFGCGNLGNLSQACASCIGGANFWAAPNQTGTQARRTPSKKLIEDVSGWTASGDRPVLKVRKPAPASIQARFSQFGPDAPVTDYLAPAVTAGAGGKRAIEALMMPAGAEGKVASLDFHDPKVMKAFVSQLMELSVREAAKIQDVPQWWEFQGPRTATYRQVGNGIPVNMGRAVIRHSLRALGFATPLNGSYADDPVSGLWPSGNEGSLRYNDPCAPFRDYPLFFPGGLLPGPSPEQRVSKLTQRQRAGFAHQGKSWKAQAMDEAKKISHVRQQYWTETMSVGEMDPIHSKILAEWNPKRAGELPPGFYSAEETFMNIWDEGWDESLWVPYLKKYGRFYGFSDRKIDRANWEGLRKMITSVYQGLDVGVPDVVGYY